MHIYNSVRTYVFILKITENLKVNLTSFYWHPIAFLSKSKDKISNNTYI